MNVRADPLTSPAEPLGALGEAQAGFGFKIGSGGAHLARTIMLDDLATLLAAAPEGAQRDDFSRIIVEENVLGKRTASNRSLSAKHLTDLYALAPKATVFRLLRFFWSLDPASRPMLAMLCAQARDSLLRLSTAWVLALKPGERITSANLVHFFGREVPDRFSEASMRSLAQNVGSSWAQAGFFVGKINKVRTRPVITPSVAAYALALGYLCGLRGQLLLESDWAQLLDVPRDQAVRLAQEASKRGWLDFKGSGNIFEINFRQLLTAKEIHLSHGPN